MFAFPSQKVTKLPCITASWLMLVVCGPASLRARLLLFAALAVCCPASLRASKDRLGPTRGPGAQKTVLSTSTSTSDQFFNMPCPFQPKMNMQIWGGMSLWQTRALVCSCDPGVRRVAWVTRVCKGRRRFSAHVFGVFLGPLLFKPVNPDGRRGCFAQHMQLLLHWPSKTSMSIMRGKP